MSTLSGTKIKDKFGNLLHVEGGLTSSTKNVEDGTGDASALKLSLTEVEINGTQSFTAAPPTANSEFTGLLINSSNQVVKRELTANAFSTDPIVPARIIARQELDRSLTAGGPASDMGFAPIDNSNPDGSYQVGSTAPYTFTTSNITIDEAGVYRIDIGFQYDSISVSNTSVTTVILVNGTAISTALRSKSVVGLSMTSFYYSKYLAAGDVITVTSLSSSGSVVLKAGSAVEVLKIS
tara:strand:+ start:1097 stop:1807 length:711 start_codon:yes stop_codon:yes gene_type:complete